MSAKGRLIALGRTKEGKTVFIDPKTRTMHLHIIGSTGEGKSKFIEHLVREDILNNNGLCLIDPHGYLYNDIVRWCETKHFLGRKKIILFDPGEEEWTFGFNPMRVSSPDVAFHVDGMVKACAQVWGGEDTDRTPLLKRCLRILFHALAEKQLSLLEAHYLIDPVDQETRRYLTRDIKDMIIQKQWDYFNALQGRQFYEEFGSTINRMMEFLSSPTIRAIIGQTEQTLNFRKIMDEGCILLVNLAPKGIISDDNARLLGSLIVNDLFMNCRGRPEGSRPFYLYIDECGLFINDDVRRILDEGRKFGLHLILAHQTLAQLKEAGENIYHSVMTNAKTKVIFGGLNTEEAEVLAKQVFLGELDLEEAKEVLNKSVVVGYIKTWLQNYSKSRSESTTSGGSRSESRGVSTGSSGSTGESEAISSANDERITTRSSGSGHSYAVSSGETETESWSHTESESESEGWSEALIPELEEMPTQVYSLEEQVYRAMSLMVNQPMQHALIKLPKKKTQMVKTPTIEPGYAREERVERFKTECYRVTDFVKPKQEVERQLEQRQLALTRKAGERDEPVAPPEPKTFRSRKKA
jgi:hypothetical protein